MVEKVNPSPNRPADAFTTAGAIAYGGGTDSSGYIVSSSEPTELSKQDPNVDETALNEFTESSSSSSFTISIDAGEAFIFGSWLVIDNSPARTFDLASDTNNQTVYVGWNRGSPNDVIVGLEPDFDNLAENTDQKIPLYTFDTDTNGVTNVTDERQLGKLIDAEDIETESVTLGELFSLTPASSEPATPSGDDVALWNSGNAVEAKFSDGSTVTLAQQ